MMTTTTTPMLTPVQVAQMLGITERAVRNFCVRGAMRATRIGRVWRIRSEDVATFLASRSNQQTNVVRLAGGAR